MTLSGIIGESYRKELYAGEGCCMNLNTWRIEPLQDRTKKVSTTINNPLPSMMQLFITSLAKEFISSDKMSLILGGFRMRLEKNGYSKEESKNIVNRCIDIFNKQRTSHMKGFMG